MNKIIVKVIEMYIYEKVNAGPALRVSKRDRRPAHVKKTKLIVIKGLYGLVITKEKGFNAPFRPRPRYI